MITKAERDKLLSFANSMVGPNAAHANFSKLVADFEAATGVSRQRARHWVAKAIRRARAPKRVLSVNALARPTSVIQETLANHVCETTGYIPRGQLWQPCRRWGCDNEPVCMNCMLCEDKHCHCFG